MPDGLVDRLSALPDDVLNLVLSRLPSDEAVQTCVLSRRWRDLWRSTPALRIVTDPSGKKKKNRRKNTWTPRSLTHFVNHLILLRAAGAPMDELEISCSQLRSDDCYDDSGYCSYDDYDAPRILPSEKAREEDLSRSAAMWIRHALSVCHARALTVSLRSTQNCLRLDGVRYVSDTLTTATISDAAFRSSGGVLDFSMCPALEDLKMSECKIHVMVISLPSVRRLSITDCSFDYSGTRRTCISAPCLVSLELGVSSGRAPFIESMPLLEAARVRIHDDCDDICRKAYGLDCDNQKRCVGCRHWSTRGESVLLEGLSRAAELELTSDPRVFIFRKDCDFGTTLANLKVLLLNEWCMAADSAPLVYFLRSSPVLEKLTLQLEYCESEHAAVKAIRNHRTKENFLVSEQLKVVKIKCPKENELVANVLMVLSAYGISKEQINIEPDFCPPTYYGYESTDSDDYY